MADPWSDIFALQPALKRYEQTLKDEDLTPDLLRSMSDVVAALSELDFQPEHAQQMVAALHSRPLSTAGAASGTSSSAAPDISDATPPASASRQEQSKSDVAPPPPSPQPSPSELISPPRNWPDSAAGATKFVSKVLKGTKMRLVGGMAPENEAVLAGVTLRIADSRGNAMRVRERTGWTILRGFVLYERREVQDGDEPYVGVAHYWNATPRGLWIDATPRLPQHASLVLVESAQPAPPPPPPYEAQATNPLVIVAVEGLCNRLRATLSYRIVAHEQGRPLHVVWRRDDYCPGHFLDVFLPIPGVRFLKTPPDGKPLSSLHVATDTHPSVKGTDGEAHSYAPLAPCDSVRQTIAAELKHLGPRFAAMHVRRTDLYTAVPASEHTTDSEFEAWADSLVPRANERRAPKHLDGMRIYVATDNADTQQRFLSLYGDAAKVHKPIKTSGALRQTGLAEAVVDLFVSAAAPDGFMASYYSSFSDAIRFLRACQGRPGAREALARASQAAADKQQRAKQQPIKEIAAAPPSTRASRPQPTPASASATVRQAASRPAPEDELVSVPPSSAQAARRAQEKAWAERAQYDRALAERMGVGSGVGVAGVGAAADDGAAMQAIEARAKEAAEHRTAKATAAAAAAAKAMGGASGGGAAGTTVGGGGGMDAPD